MRLTFLLLLLPSFAAAGPKVLLLGDSISIGYTPHVQRMLEGTAEVSRPMRNEKHAENCQYSAFGLASLDRWLGESKWDVIHFNFGLHDLKYIGQDLPDARIVPQRGEEILKAPNAHQLCPVENYAANLEKIVQRLKKTGAKLIFATTTPVPEGAVGRFKGDAAKYNTAAAAVMKRHGVAINDLHAVASARLAEIQRPSDVHFSKEGSAALATEVVTHLRKALGLEPTAKIDDRPRRPRFSTSPNPASHRTSTRQNSAPLNATAPRNRSAAGLLFPPKK